MSSGRPLKITQEVLRHSKLSRRLTERQAMARRLRSFFSLVRLSFQIRIDNLGSRSRCVRVQVKTILNVSFTRKRDHCYELAEKRKLIGTNAAIRSIAILVAFILPLISESLSNNLAKFLQVLCFALPNFRSPTRTGGAHRRSDAEAFENARYVHETRC